MTWNYYLYNVMCVESDTYQCTVCECGEDLQRARFKLGEYRRNHPDKKYVIQQIHSVARIVH